LLLTRLATLLLAAAACAGCDQSMKYAARSYLQAHASVSIVDGTLRLTLAENPGGFLSLGAALPGPARDLLFLGVVPAVLIGFALYVAARRALGRRKVLAAALVIGGGASNLLDRVLYDGYVTDFLSIGLGPLRTGVFNIADVAVLAGAVYLILSNLGTEKPET
jgi:signal peptidase II